MALAVLQCTSDYPTAPAQVGLNLLGELARRYGVPVGLSDHSGTIFPGLAAVALGASVVEVHLALSREQFGPDVAVSLTPDDLRRLTDGRGLPVRGPGPPAGQGRRGHPPGPHARPVHPEPGAARPPARRLGAHPRRPGGQEAGYRHGPRPPGRGGGPAPGPRPAGRSPVGAGRPGAGDRESHRLRRHHRPPQLQPGAHRAERHPRPPRARPAAGRGVLRAARPLRQRREPDRGRRVPHRRAGLHRHRGGEPHHHGQVDRPGAAGALVGARQPAARCGGHHRRSLRDDRHRGGRRLPEHPAGPPPGRRDHRLHRREGPPRGDEAGRPAPGEHRPGRRAGDPHGGGPGLRVRDRAARRSTWPPRSSTPPSSTSIPSSATAGWATRST